MYREVLEPRRGRLSDTAVVLICVAVIVVFEPAMVLSGFPQVIKTVGQSVLVAAIVAFCLWFYRRRLRSFRYTLITDNTERFGETENLPSAWRELPAGTFLCETLVGMGAGTFLSVVKPGEIRGFFGRGEAFVLPDKAKTVSATLDRREYTCVLLYEQDEKKYALYFSPGEALEKELSSLYGVNAK